MFDEPSGESNTERRLKISTSISTEGTMLLLTNCEVHAGKYLDRSFEVRTERSEVRTKN